MSCLVPVEAFDRSGQLLSADNMTIYEGLARNFSSNFNAAYHIIGNSSKSKVSITVWIPLSQEPVSIFIAAAQDLVLLHPSAAVNVSSVGWDTVQSADLTCGEDDCATVVMLGTTQFSYRLENEDVADLTDYLFEYSLRSGRILTDDFLRYYFTTFSSGGSWQAVPIISDTRIMYYNETTLEAAGMKLPPPNGNTTDKWSWVEFAQQATELFDKTGLESFLFREGPASTETYLILAAMYDYGASLYKVEKNGLHTSNLSKNGAITDHAEKVLDPLFHRAGMRLSAAFTGSNAVKFSSWLATDYSEGDVQPIFDGPSYEIRKEPLLGYAILPPSARNVSYPELKIAYAPGTFSFLGGSGLMLSNHSPEKDLGWEYIQSLLQHVDDLGLSLNSPPPYESSLRLPLWQTEKWRIISQQLRQSVPPEYPLPPLAAIAKNLFSGPQPLREFWMNRRFKNHTIVDDVATLNARVNAILSPVCTESDHRDPLCHSCGLQDYDMVVGRCSRLGVLPVHFARAQNSTCTAFDPSPVPALLDCDFIGSGTAPGVILILLTGLTALSVLMTVGKMLVIEDSVAVKLVQPSMLFLICVGILLLCLSIIVRVDNNTCLPWLWLFTFGFDLVIGAVFVRLFRVWRLFYRHRRHATSSSSSVYLRQALMTVGLLMVVDVIFLAVWSVYFGPHIYMHEISGFLVGVPRCGSSSLVMTSVFFVSRFAYLLICSTFGVMLFNVSDTIVNSRLSTYTSLNFFTSSSLFIIALTFFNVRKMAYVQGFMILLSMLAPIFTLVIPSLRNKVELKLRTELSARGPLSSTSQPLSTESVRTC